MINGHSSRIPKLGELNFYQFADFSRHCKTLRKGEKYTALLPIQVERTRERPLHQVMLKQLRNPVYGIILACAKRDASFIN